MAKKRKFYKKKKPVVKELPKNSRTITEILYTDHTIFLLGLTGIVFAIVIVSFNLYGNIKMNERIINERNDVVGSLEFWNREVIDKPGYRDGYFSLSLIYYQLGDIYNSTENLDKSLSIDPNFERGKEFRNYLDNNY